MHIAEINIARMQAPLDADSMKEFRDFLDPVNALAESSPGFVWRYEEGAGVQEKQPAPPFGDGLIIVNLSVWESVEQLRDFTFQTVHSYFLRKRGRWFTGLGHPQVACWWVAKGARPTVAEAKAKLELLQRIGTSEAAFALSDNYPASIKGIGKAADA
ncbi:DUF3291 domain-containing protein [Neolewinella antarctica]|uniref:DUF3291 domain-containing protein n=1 Tax=Neolewinella antarctica TaxID=442734 RepID=A0ABX0XH59_9BACT|nr:DUF3291 domain-containing protein [Neolewinella antarctica]NJC28082.1 hypothetical protein [Neolewinella antarctica]